VVVDPRNTCYSLGLAAGVFILELKEAAAPIVRLIGHMLAVALGFVVFAAVSMIPVAMVHVMVAFGFTDLAQLLHNMEKFILWVDICVFVVVFLSGVFVFLTEVWLSAKAQIQQARRNLQNEPKN
jgi:ABC-type uncharacterized transport system fused permease/ATPase subunit